MRKGTSSRRGDEAMFSGIEKQFYFYGRNRSLTTIRGASYKLDGTELSGYVCPFLRYLRSPDNSIEVRIRTAKSIRYDVLLRGRALLQECTLSLDVDHKKMGLDPKVIKSKERNENQILEPAVRQKFAKIRDNYKEMRLEMEGGYAVVFRAYNEGVAYRFETSLTQEQVKIYGEEMTLDFPSNSVVYYPQEDSFFSHNERKYTPQHLREIAAEFIASLPAVVDVGEGAKVAIAESDVEEYPGLWLRGTGGNGLSATFPPY